MWFIRKDFFLRVFLPVAVVCRVRFLVKEGASAWRVWLRLIGCHELSHPVWGSQGEKLLGDSAHSQGPLVFAFKQLRRGWLKSWYRTAISVDHDKNNCSIEQVEQKKTIHWSSTPCSIFFFLQVFYKKDRGMRLWEIIFFVISQFSH